jgi:hypothetical protein
LLRPIHGMNTRPRPRIRFGVSCGTVILVSAIALIWAFFSWAWTGVKEALGFPTPTPHIYDCYRWQEIDRSMVGKSECAYGTIVGMVNTTSTAESTRIYFSSNSGDFFLHDASHYFPDLAMGICVQAKGTIYQLSGVLYMEISDLYECK